MCVYCHQLDRTPWYCTRSNFKLVSVVLKVKRYVNMLPCRNTESTRSDLIFFKVTRRFFSSLILLRVRHDILETIGTNGGEMFLTPSKPHFFEVTSPKQDDGLEARSGHRIIIDDQYMYSWGGFNPEFWEHENTVDTSYPLFRELWRYEFATNEWKKLRITGDVPEGLASHTIVKLNDHILHIGGSGVPFGQSNANAVYDLDLQTLQWKCLVQEVQNWWENEAPRPKYGQTLSQVEEYLYIVGGTSGFTYDMEVNRLNLKSLKWEHLESQSTYHPEERYRHETVHFCGKLYVFGGGTALIENTLDTIDAFDIETQKWEKISTVPFHDSDKQKDVFPAPRKCHSCHLLNDDVYFIGGLCGKSIEEMLWKLHLPSIQWTRLDHLKLPKPVYFHGSALSKDGCLFVFGGVTEMDVSRTNCLQAVWLTVPSLKTISWAAVRKCLDLTKLRQNRDTLLYLGVPEYFLDIS